MVKRECHHPAATLSRSVRVSLGDDPLYCLTARGRPYWRGRKIDTMMDEYARDVEAVRYLHPEHYLPQHKQE